MGPACPSSSWGRFAWSRWYDVWQPLTVMVVGEAVAFPVRDTTNRCHWCDYDAATGDRLDELDNLGLQAPLGETQAWPAR